ncbi:hypothetical protein [Castellaniella sp.]|uniref:hypothetical protein n=1 Tax=Castellaniella sp. TaxID=1955812 RepID=UPI002AFF458F|nr:hypothetical protein [Castellaniella sp.]
MSIDAEPTDAQILAWAAEEQFFLFCDEDDLLQIVRAALHRFGRSAVQPQSCNHIFEAQPIDGSWSASVSCEPVCAKCGYRPAVNATKGAQR